MTAQPVPDAPAVSFVERIRLAYLDAEEWAAQRSVEAHADGDRSGAAIAKLAADRAGAAADALRALR